MSRVIGTEEREMKHITDKIGATPCARIIGHCRQEIEQYENGAYDRQRHVLKKGIVEGERKQIYQERQREEGDEVDDDG